jgi:hypothetical protein
MTSSDPARLGQLDTCGRNHRRLKTVQSIVPAKEKLDESPSRSRSASRSLRPLCSVHFEVGARSVAVTEIAVVRSRSVDVWLSAHSNCSTFRHHSLISGPRLLGRGFWELAGYWFTVELWLAMRFSIWSAGGGRAVLWFHIAEVGVPPDSRPRRRCWWSGPPQALFGEADHGYS